MAEQSPSSTSMANTTQSTTSAPTTVARSPKGHWKGMRFAVRGMAPGSTSGPARRFAYPPSSRSTPMPSRSEARTSTSRSKTDRPSGPILLRRQTQPSLTRPTRMKPMPEQDAIVDALRTVMDPELNVNVVDLGLVYTIQSREDEVDV